MWASSRVLTQRLPRRPTACVDPRVAAGVGLRGHLGRGFDQAGLLLLEQRGLAREQVGGERQAAGARELTVCALANGLAQLRQRGQPRARAGRGVRGRCVAGRR